jgi:hypothetical protein
VPTWPCTACPVCAKPATAVSFMHKQTRQDSPPTRCGRWTLEEERYAEALIEEFMAGRLLLRRDSKLGSVLQSLLCRSAAGINRKFPGAKTLIFARHAASETETPEQHLLRQQRLQNLEGIYLIAQNCAADASTAAALPRVLLQQWQRLLSEFLPEVGQTVAQLEESSSTSASGRDSPDSMAVDPSEPCTASACLPPSPSSADVAQWQAQAAAARRYPAVRTATVRSPSPTAAAAAAAAVAASVASSSSSASPRAVVKGSPQLQPSAFEQALRCSLPGAPPAATSSSTGQKRSRRTMSETSSAFAGLWINGDGSAAQDTPMRVSYFDNESLLYLGCILHRLLSDLVFLVQCVEQTILSCRVLTAFHYAVC